jgi:protein transport protein SEC24
MDADKSCIVTIEHDGAEIKQGTEGYVQVAVLYTSVCGQRRVRTINIAFPYSTSLADVFRHSDMWALATTLSRDAVSQLALEGIGSVQKFLTQKAVEVLHSYRKYCATNSAPGQLILPEALKYLPLIALSIIKSPVARSNVGNRSIKAALRSDDRVDAFAHFTSSSVQSVALSLYPRFVKIVEDGKPAAADLPLIALSAEKIQAKDAYLLYDGSLCYMYFGEQTAPTTLDMIFAPGAGSVLTNPDGAGSLQFAPQTNPLSEFVVSAVRRITDTANGELPQPIVVIHKAKHHAEFMRKLVEDQFGAGDASYITYLCDCHKRIQRLLSQSH